MGVNDIIKVGSNIKKFRKERKMSQKEMAKILNIPSSTYSNYENNNREPSAEVLKKIAQVLNVDLKILLGVNQEANDENNKHKYLSDDTATIEVIENLIKLCEFKINFNKFTGSDKEIEESLKIAIKNNTIPLTYISNGNNNLDLTNSEFMKLTDKVLNFVKFEVNELIEKKS